LEKGDDQQNGEIALPRTPPYCYFVNNKRVSTVDQPFRYFIPEGNFFTGVISRSVDSKDPTGSAPAKLKLKAVSIWYPAKVGQNTKMEII